MPILWVPLGTFWVIIMSHLCCSSISGRLLWHIFSEGTKAVSFFVTDLYKCGGAVSILWVPPGTSLGSLDLWVTLREFLSVSIWHLAHCCPIFLCYLGREIFRWSSQKSKYQWQRSSSWAINYLTLNIWQQSTSNIFLRVLRLTIFSAFSWTLLWPMTTIVFLSSPHSLPLLGGYTEGTM